MKNETKIKRAEKPDKFVEGVDYYFENGLMVLTAFFLRNRGYCCANNCRNCPYPTDEKTKIYNKNVSNSRF